MKELFDKLNELGKNGCTIELDGEPYHTDAKLIIEFNGGGKMVLSTDGDWCGAHWFILKEGE